MTFLTSTADFICLTFLLHSQSQLSTQSWDSSYFPSKVTNVNTCPEQCRWCQQCRQLQEGDWYSTAEGFQLCHKVLHVQRLCIALCMQGLHKSPLFTGALHIPQCTERFPLDVYRNFICAYLHGGQFTKQVLLEITYISRPVQKTLFCQNPLSLSEGVSH